MIQWKLGITQIHYEKIRLWGTAENCRNPTNKEVFGILQAFDTAHCSSTEGETAHLL
jgi:hypothetical protein